jgi:glycosidase
MNDDIHEGTPMGAQLAERGAMFRTWAPGAKEVYVVLHDFDVQSPTGWKKNDQDLLIRDANGYWAGFFPGVVDGSEYRFWIVGHGGEGFKIYFLRDGHAGGLIFAFGKPEVRQFLIDNARMLVGEYHVDGFRYDQVTVMDEHGGWFFCQDLTSTLRFIKPGAIQIAEYWGIECWRGVVSPPDGMGFDAGYNDGLRDRIRAAIEQSTGGSGSRVNLEELRDALQPPHNFPSAWKAFQCIENHDLIDASLNENTFYDHSYGLGFPGDGRWEEIFNSDIYDNFLIRAPRAIRAESPQADRACTAYQVLRASRFLPIAFWYSPATEATLGN